MCLNEKENAHFILFLFIAISINSFTNLYYTLDIISVRVCVCVCLNAVRHTAFIFEPAISFPLGGVDEVFHLH